MDGLRPTYQMIRLTQNPINRAEHYGHDDKPRIPIVPVVDSCHPKEHEYNCFRTAGQHLHGILDRCVRLVRYISFHVILHGYPAKSDPVEESFVILFSLINNPLLS